MPPAGMGGRWRAGDVGDLNKHPDYDMHYTRWDMVRELRDRRVELALPRRLPDGTTASYAPTWKPRMKTPRSTGRDVVRRRATQSKRVTS